MNYVMYRIFGTDLMLDLLDRFGFQYDFHRWRVPSGRWHYSVRIWR